VGPLSNRVTEIRTVATSLGLANAGRWPCERFTAEQVTGGPVWWGKKLGCAADFSLRVLDTPSPLFSTIIDFVSLGDMEPGRVRRVAAGLLGRRAGRSYRGAPFRQVDRFALSDSGRLIKRARYYLADADREPSHAAAVRERGPADRDAGGGGRAAGGR